MAHDIADNARPETDKFIENVMRPAVKDLIETLEKQADEMSKKVCHVLLKESIYLVYKPRIKCVVPCLLNLSASAVARPADDEQQDLGP